MLKAQMIIRLDMELKDKVSKIAKQEGKAAGQVVRDLLNQYVKERDMASYIDDLWSRIGNKVKSKDIKPEDISKAIKNIRANK
jgi:predicted DNA-binding protein